MKKVNRVGEKHITKWGDTIEIIEYFGSHKCTVRFIDGTTIKNRDYKDILVGCIKKPKNYINTNHLTKEGYTITVIEFHNYKNCTIQFNDTKNTILKNRGFDSVKKGTIRNPYHPSVYGIGYVGIEKYNRHTTKYKSIWSGMLERCYSKKRHKNNQSYIGCSVSEEWHNFQNFVKWYKENYNPETMKGWQLDKDILIKGNKVYSPETCAFVPQTINSLFIKCDINRGNTPIGVFELESGKFSASMNRYGKLLHLGTFKTIEEAFYSYKTAKESYIKEVADKWKDKIDSKVYQAMYNYQVEITD